MKKGYRIKIGDLVVVTQKRYEEAINHKRINPRLKSVWDDRAIKYYKIPQKVTDIGIDGIKTEQVGNFWSPISLELYKEHFNGDLFEI